MSKIKIGGLKIPNPVDVGKDVFNEAKGAAHDVQHGVEDAANMGKEQVEQIVNLAIKELIDIGAGTILHKMAHVFEAAAPDTFQITVGPVSMEVEDVHGKLDTIKVLANNPPKSKRQFRGMIEALAPSKISISVSGEIAFVIFGSSSLGAGFSMTWHPVDFVKRFDNILDSIL